MKSKSKLNRKFLILFCILLSILLIQTKLFSQIIINEVQSHNTNTIYDEDGETPDWVELYNSSEKEINLKDYSISDDPNEIHKWVFPEIIMKPNEYLYLFASGKDRKIPIIGSKNSSMGFGHWKYRDNFSFHYKEIDGDFDISVQISYFELIDEFSEAGIMIRENLNDRSKYTGCFFTNKSKFFIHINPSLNPEIEQKWFKLWDIDFLMNFPNVWIRITKIRDTISVFFSETGNSWHFHSCFPIDLENKCYIGIASTSGTSNSTSTLFVKNLKINNIPYEYDKLNKIDIGENSHSEILSSHYHLPFSLKKENDSLFLFKENNLINIIKIPKLKKDISYGIKDGLYKYFEKPTPLKTNNIGMDSICAKPIIYSSIYENNDKEIEISFSNIGKIYYTVDCSIPDSNKTLWDGKPIKLKTPFVIKTIGYSDYKIPSEIVTKSFIYQENPEISFVSITANPDYLFNEATGLLKSDPNLLRNVEYECDFEYFERKKFAYTMNCGLSLQGNLSRILEQKALKLIARSIYNEKRFNYNFFEEFPNARVNKRLSLRNCSMDWSQTMIRDAFANKLCQFLKLDDYELVKPVTVFLNSEYWGLYNFQTKINESYLSEKYNIMENEINVLLYNSFPDNGDNNSYIEFIDSLNKIEVLKDDYLLSKIDLNSFTEYFFIQFFSANYDWPHRNSKIWNSNTISPKWKWIPYDFDESFMPFHVNSSMFVRLEDSTLGIDKYNVFYPIYKIILSSDSLKNIVFSRFQDLLNYTFTSNKVLPVFNQMVLERSSEISKQKNRWPNSLQNYQENIDGIRFFIEKRPMVLLNQIVELFYPSGVSQILLKSNIANSGLFKFNSLSNIDSISGLFIKDLPLTITAKPVKGYAFIGWSCDTTKNSTITIYPKTDMEIIAFFEKVETEEINIVINEIMYKSPDNRDTKDWIELYNNGKSAVNLSGWIFKDSDDLHIFSLAEGTILNSDEYLVLINDKSEFTRFYPEITNFLGSFNFGLGRGDAIKIYNPEGELFDIVEYGISSPWPSEPDGTGSSLELINPNLDNSLALNWKASAVDLGTPGIKNSIFNSVKEPNILSNDISIFPNPASSFIKLNCSKEMNSIISISLYDIFGNELLMIKRSELCDDKRYFLFDVNKFVNGIYLLRIYYTDDSNNIKNEILKFIVKH